MPNRLWLTFLLLALPLLPGNLACQRLTPSEDGADGQDANLRNPDSEAKPDPTRTPTQEPTATATPTVVQRLEPNLESMRSVLVERSCIACHRSATSDNRYVDLTDLTAIITRTSPSDLPGQARKVIRAGCPDSSMFYLSVKNGSMPKPPASAVSSQDREVIKSWILGLAAPGEIIDCNDEPPDDDLTP